MRHSPKNNHKNNEEFYSYIQNRIDLVKDNYIKKRKAGRIIDCTEELGFLRYIDDPEYGTIYEDHVNYLRNWFYTLLMRKSEIVNNSSEEIYIRSCINIVTTLNNIEAPDMEFLNGLLCQEQGEIDHAINWYGKVSERAKDYQLANIKKAELLAKYKKYTELAAFLDEKRSCFRSLDDTYYRLECLARNKIDDESITGIQRYPFRKIEIGEDSTNPDKRYRICLDIVRIIVSAYLFMYRCLNYYQTYKRDFDVDNNHDIRILVDGYNKLVFILKQCDCIGFIRNKNGGRLVDLTLERFSWTEKFSIIQKPEYSRNIVETIVSLTAPEVHPNIDKKTAAVVLLDNVFFAGVGFAAQVLDMYYKEIAAAVNEKNRNAIENVSKIMIFQSVNGIDHYNLNERIQILFEKNDIDIADRINSSKFAAWLSIPGRELYKSTEEHYSYVINKQLEMYDASSIATAYFRIFEIEFNNKLIAPLVKSLDMEKLSEEFSKGKNIQNQNDKNEFSKKWSLLIKTFQKIKEDPEKTMELGKIRNLFTGLRTSVDEWGNYTNGVGSLIYDTLSTFLTESGKEALYSGDLENIISKERIDIYRNPLSHTKIIPFSIATESREIFNVDMPKLINWIKKEVQ